MWIKQSPSRHMLSKLPNPDGRIREKSSNWLPLWRNRWKTSFWRNPKLKTGNRYKCATDAAIQKCFFSELGRDAGPCLGQGDQTKIRHWSIRGLSTNPKLTSSEHFLSQTTKKFTPWWFRQQADGTIHASTQKVFPRKLVIWRNQWWNDNALFDKLVSVRWTATRQTSYSRQPTDVPIFKLVKCNRPRDIAESDSSISGFEHELINQAPQHIQCTHQSRSNWQPCLAYNLDPPTRTTGQSPEKPCAGEELPKRSLLALLWDTKLFAFCTMK